MLSSTHREMASFTMLKQALLFIFLIFLLQELMREMEGNLNYLTRLKDFDERTSQEIAARAYQQQEIMKLKVIIKTVAFFILSFSSMFTKYKT